MGMLKGLRRVIFILSFVLPGLFSCVEKEVDFPDTEQTVFMYMPWSGDLKSFFEVNIKDFEQAIAGGILEKERILVFLSSSPSQASLFELKYDHGSCTRNILKTYVDPSLNTSDWITSILNDVKAFAPAGRYAMIIGGHGMGWLPVTASRQFVLENRQNDRGVPVTRYFGGLSPDYQTDITTLARGIAGAGIMMDYILFDDCYMSTIEVAYELRNVTKHLIASPTEMMAYGFPYAEIGEYLLGDVDFYSLCEGFHDFYRDYIVPSGTIAVTDCSELDSLAVLMKEINQRFTLDSLKLGSIQPMDGYNPVIFFDYGDYMEKLCSDKTLLDAFKVRLTRAVPYAFHTPSYFSMNRGMIKINGFSGITISDPSVNSKTSQKVGTAWYKATH